MKETEIQDELASIRSLMERSSKFISLSGLSGILAGVYALIGSAIAFVLLGYDRADFYTKVLDYSENDTYFVVSPPANNLLIAIAAAVLIASVLTGIILSVRKAKRKGQSIWNKTSRELLFHMAVPLVAGGLLIIIFIARGYYGVVAPVSLIFYGLSLVAAGNFTFSGIKSLGLCEIILGLIAALFPGYGLYFWAFGFGILHIIYGSVMYLKYDR
ncbi:hypothetical protein FO440_06780 [Mucilaginibacter corticis]|uniref:Uncharacterized protein n=1 Tax=Mucilaginibacter corticis TaxID=2597670 RepID=A0A556MVB5_9SPHI|nr:hypothetical protein [Mucilaginibacter corticis]TSJ43884.1 hypothetical protein FO440_06780 [Mucilaginibacter corticis]